MIRGSVPDRDQEIFQPSKTSRAAPLSTQAPIQRAEELFSPARRGLQCEFNHSPQTTTDFKNEWSYVSTPLHAFIS